MKHTSLLAFSLSTFTFSLPASEVLVCPHTFQDVAGKPLVIAEQATGETAFRPRKWTFAGANFSRRTAWNVPARTNAALVAFIDIDADGMYTPGEPFGCSNGRVPHDIELTDMSAICPRLDLWEDRSDRQAFTYDPDFTGWELVPESDRWHGSFVDFTAPAEKVRVTVSRFFVDGYDIAEAGLYGLHNVVFDKTFKRSDLSTFDESLFVDDGNPDIDWANFYGEISDNRSVWQLGSDVTNVTYIVKFDFDQFDYTGTNRTLKTKIVRRFEKVRTIPTAVGSVTTNGTTTFVFRFDGEDPYASWFGTTYTACKVKVLNGTNETWNSGIVRLPVKSCDGTYRLTVDRTFASGLTWRAALYNSKFREDTMLSLDERDPTGDQIFSPAMSMSVVPPPPPRDKVTSTVVIYPGRHADISAPIVIETRPDDPSEKPQQWTLPAADYPRFPRVVRSVSSTCTNFAAYVDTDGNGKYTPGEPFGVSNGRCPPEIELTDMSAVCPRFDLWEDRSDRQAFTYNPDFTGWELVPESDRWHGSFVDFTAPAEKVRVTVSRFFIDGYELYETGMIGKENVVFDKTFIRSALTTFDEGLIVNGDNPDIDWNRFYDEAVDFPGVQTAGCDVTNVTYIVKFDFDPFDYRGTNRTLKTKIVRRFEKVRTIPTAVGSVTTNGTTTFVFRIDGEDPRASWFGTTYTACKVKVLSGSTETWNSGIVRLPVKSCDGTYRIKVDRTFSSGLTWRAALYNSKFKEDTLWAMERHDNTGNRIFSPATPIE